MPRTKNSTTAAPAKRAKAPAKAPAKRAAAPAKRARAAKAAPAPEAPKRPRGRPRKVVTEPVEPKRPRGRPAMDPDERKQPVPLRLPPEILNWWKDTGEGWRKDMEQLLIDHATAQQARQKRRRTAA